MRVPCQPMFTWKLHSLLWLRRCKDVMGETVFDAHKQLIVSGWGDGRVFPFLYLKLSRDQKCRPHAWLSENGCHTAHLTYRCICYDVKKPGQTAAWSVEMLRSRDTATKQRGTESVYQLFVRIWKLQLFWKKIKHLERTYRQTQDCILQEEEWWLTAGHSYHARARITNSHLSTKCNV